MRNFLLILRIRLDEAMNISRARHSTRKGERTETMMYSAFRVIVFAALFILLFALCSYLGKRGIAAVLPSMFYSVAFTVSFLLTIVNMNEMITGNEDSEYLLSAPISEFNYVFVMFLSLYVKSFVWVVLLCIPAGIVYNQYMSPDALFYVRWAIGLVLTPLPMGGFGALAGMAITLILAENPNKNRIQSCISLSFAFIGIVVILLLVDRVGLVLLKGLGDAPEEVSAAIIAVIVKNSLFSRFYQNAVVVGNGGYMFIFTLVSLVWYLAISMLVGLSYRIMVISLRCPVHYKLYEWKEQKQTDIEKALMKREYSLFFGSKSYMTKSIVGLLAGILLPLNFLIISPQQFLSIFYLENRLAAVTHAVPWLICFFVGLGCTSYCSFSIEGRRSWISESSPIDKKLLYRCKARLNLMLTLPFALVSGILFALAFRPGVLWSAVYILVPLVYAVVSAWWGINIDFRYGDSSRESETQAMHQGKSYLFGYLPGLILPIIMMLVL